MKQGPNRPFREVGSTSSGLLNAAKAKNLRAWEWLVEAYEQLIQH